MRLHHACRHGETTRDSTARCACMDLDDVASLVLRGGDCLARATALIRVYRFKFEADKASNGGAVSPFSAAYKYYVQGLSFLAEQ